MSTRQACQAKILKSPLVTPLKSDIYNALVVSPLGDTHQVPGDLVSCISR